MLSERVAAYAQDLRAWRRDGVITGLGAEHRQDGVGLPLDLAVAIVLADLDDLDDRATSGAVIDDSSWRQLSDDIEQLHRLVADRLPA
jgi:hypothetical protein